MRVLLPILLLAIAPLGAAQPFSIETELIPSELSAAASFGSAVAIDGDLALVGAINANSVYVFARSGDGWAEETVLSPAELDPGDSFGEYLAFDGQRLLVSARGDDAAAGDDVGAVYVYDLIDGEWTLQTKLTASDGEAGDLFGQDLGLDGDQAIITTQFGAAAYVFTYDGTDWTQEAILTPDDPEETPFFGLTAEIEGDIALVGAPQATVDGTPEAGAVLVYTRTEGVWTQTETLTVNSDDNTDRIGQALDYENGTLVTTTRASFRAPAYVFGFDGAEWTLEAELPPSEDGPAYIASGIGHPIELDGDRVLLGAFSGAYLFTRMDGTWSLTTEIDGSEEDISFGQNVYLDGAQAIIGARNANGFTGRAFVYSSNTVSNAAGPADRPALTVSVYPNPAAHWADVAYEIDQTSRVRIDVYDLLGRRLMTTTDLATSAGPQTLRLGVGDLAPGLYVLRLRVGTQVATEKLLIQR